MQAITLKSVYESTNLYGEVLVQPEKAYNKFVAMRIAESKTIKKTLIYTIAKIANFILVPLAGIGMAVKYLHARLIVRSNEKNLNLILKYIENPEEVPSKDPFAKVFGKPIAMYTDEKEKGKKEVSDIFERMNKQFITCNFAIMTDLIYMPIKENGAKAISVYLEFFKKADLDAINAK